jgi:16S rRNA (guanine527-N7)-methyltransferase
VTNALAALSRSAVAALGRPLSDRELDSFAKYMNMLIKWQRTHRLMGSDSPAWIVENLFLDSLLFLKVLPSKIRSMLDLGSGAGLPGIPIKIVRPEIHLVLVESRQRRASFLASAVREVGLEGVRVIGGRVEDFLEELEGRFDAVVLRCAGDLEDLLPLAAKLVAAGGIVAASGPPTPRPLSLGEWVTVPATRPGMTRRFAVYRRA